MKLWESILDLLFPPKCIFCGRLLQKGENGACPACEKTLPRTPGLPRKVEFLDGVYSPLFYEGTVRDALLRYKFRNDPASGKTFAKFMQETVENSPEIRYDIISWVPLSRKRERSRGYDQARLLAEALGRGLQMPVQRTLRKTRNAPAQSGLSSASERRANISGCYETDESFSPKGKRILLVDDIVTTGSTLSECARVLLTGGAAGVTAITAASRQLEKKP